MHFYRCEICKFIELWLIARTCRHHAQANSKIYLICMAITVTEREEGKQVVHEGEVVGRVIDVEHGTAYVDPDPGLTETFLSMLGWAESEGDSYALQSEAVAEVTETEIRLKEF